MVAVVGLFMGKERGKEDRPTGRKDRQARKTDRPTVLLNKSKSIMHMEMSRKVSSSPAEKPAKV